MNSSSRGGTLELILVLCAGEDEWWRVVVPVTMELLEIVPHDNVIPHDDIRK